MSGNEAPGAGGLQFDHAEMPQGRDLTRCTACQGDIHSAYFEIDGQVACASCARKAGTVEGTGPVRFLRACAFGTVAAAFGSAIYYGVRALTGYEFGLIAIVVGLAVGGAVRAGSHRRGGWLYQGLAIFLTYASIVSTYVPYIVEGMRQAKEGAKPAVVAPARTDGAPAGTRAADEPAAQEATATPGALALAVGLVILVVVAFAAPFLAGVENIMGIVIIGIGLYEAWKINRRVVQVVTGPYRVSPPAAAPAQP